MDARKCQALKDSLADLDEADRLVSVDRFRDVLLGVQHRADVEAVYLRIFELDPGEPFWPFTDTVLVVGTVSADELSQLLEPLQPDQVGPGEELGPLPRIHKGPVLAVWWD